MSLKMTYSNHIPLRLEFKGTAEEVKCLTILYSYLDEALNASNAVVVKRILHFLRNETFAGWTLKILMT